MCLGLILASCTKDDEKLVLSASEIGSITAPANNQEIILNPVETATNTAVTFQWQAATYSTPTEVTYELQLAADPNFETIAIAGSTPNNHMTLSIERLNGLALDAGLTPFSPGVLQARVRAGIGNNSEQPQYTNPINLIVTTFTLDLPRIAVPGNHQGWNPSEAPQMASSGFEQTDYQGYIWLDGEYKFLAPDASGKFDWGNTDWGDDGSFTGVLVETDEANCNATTAGIHFVKADTAELTYEATPVHWGIIGAATPTGWDSDTDLIYNPDTQKLELDIDLTPGEFKFRGNDEWGAFDLGTVDDNGHLQSGGNLSLEGSAGNYHVVLDLSNPRAYTYTITQN